jgi:hypothetical protein
LELGSLLEDVQDRIRPLQARFFPRLVLLELHDESLRGQVLGDGGEPGPVSIEAPLPALTCRNGLPLEKEPLGDLIGDLLVRDGLIEALVMAALPPAAVHCRVIEWPLSEIPDEPIEALRQIDPPLRLPFPLEEASLDLHPLPGGASPRMLLAAAPRALVDAWIQVFNLAGVQLERLAPAQTCQLAALQERLAGAPGDRLIALLEAGPEERRLVLVEGGVPVFEWELPGDDGALVAEVARCLRFYRRRSPEVRDLELLLVRPSPLAERLARELATTPVPLTAEPFGSLVLQGLATPEVAA